MFSICIKNWWKLWCKEKSEIVFLILFNSLIPYKMLLLLLRWIIAITVKEIHFLTFLPPSPEFSKGVGWAEMSLVAGGWDLWPRRLKSFKVQTEHFNHFDLLTFFPDKNCLENREPETNTMKLGDPAFKKHLERTKQRKKTSKTNSSSDKTT